MFIVLPQGYLNSPISSHNLISNDLASNIVVYYIDDIVIMSVEQTATDLNEIVTHVFNQA